MSQMMNRGEITLKVSKLHVYPIIKNILNICTLIPRLYRELVALGCSLHFISIYQGESLRSRLCATLPERRHMFFSVPWYRAVCSNAYWIHSISLEHCIIMYNYNDQNPAKIQESSHLSQSMSLQANRMSRLGRLSAQGAWFFGTLCIQEWW